ncbi:TlpA family protein disulfide reductase [Zoogloea sp.]|uniref:TlpA family protein disulfide reductase n=1 Tax=Zoogloea sp. TaxID=49181 RepID=UPI00261BEC94|nr:TlpA disulfide reductase family protein [uncultured Zoogloea sp.]MCK6386184.1 TlpA family protein disulfide reductase [Zoogloea sp.]
MKNKLTIAVAVVAAVAAAAAGVYTARQQHTAPSAAPATPSQAQHAALNTLLGLELADADGARQPLAQWKGKILVLNFWATWCPPCRHEIPAFSAMSSKYRDKGVQFVGISIDTASNVRSFQREHQVSYPLLIAEPSVVQLTESLGNAAQGLPFTVIVDKTGVISRVKVGMLSETDLDTTLGRLTRP